MRRNLADSSKEEYKLETPELQNHSNLTDYSSSKNKTKVRADHSTESKHRRNLLANLIKNL